MMDQSSRRSTLSDTAALMRSDPMNSALSAFERFGLASANSLVPARALLLMALLTLACLPRSLAATNLDNAHAAPSAADLPARPHGVPASAGQPSLPHEVPGPASQISTVPAPEKLLPNDTLVLITAPDIHQLKRVLARAPQGQLWHDEAMKPFREKFLAKWDEQLLKPLSRDLGVSVEAYAALPQGQVTFAITQNGWQGRDNQPLGMLLLVDVQSKETELKTNLAELRKKWTESGKGLRVEKIRDLEFTILPMGSNKVPRLLQQFFPHTMPFEELGSENRTPAKATRNEIVIGQAGPLLIVANSTPAVEQLLMRLQGGIAPALADTAAYSANRGLFRDSPFYVWVNTQTISDVLGRRAAERPASTAPAPVDDLRGDKFMLASGLMGLRTAALALQPASEGLQMELFLRAPEASRQGLLKILATSTKDWNPPPFVPGDAARFQRWRMDGQQACRLLQQVLANSSPQSLNGLKAIIDTAHDAAKLNTPGYDLRTTLLANLGDDWINYEKAPRGNSAEEIDNPPSLWLIGSPNPEQLAGCLKWLLVVLSDTPAEREFLGRKIYSVPQPPLPLLVSESSRSGPPRTLYYTATSGYVALTTDVSLLEEYLRSPESLARPLRETAGLAEAAQHVAGPGTSLFGFVNQAQTDKATIEALRGNPAGTNSVALLGPLPALLGLAAPEKNVEDWMDFSLLPPFEAIAKYFHFRVYGGTATAEGLSFRFFSPTPPELRKIEAARK
jgi:hypothetical protein